MHRVESPIPERNRCRTHACWQYRHRRTVRGLDSNYHATRNVARDLQQIGLHVDDLVLPVPFALEDVLHAVDLETDGAVDAAVLVGAVLYQNEFEFCYAPRPAAPHRFEDLPTRLQMRSTAECTQLCFNARRSEPPA